MSERTTETRGEGFAYFRWHFLRWPYRCTCAYSDVHFCVWLWRDHDRS